MCSYAKCYFSIMTSYFGFTVGILLDRFPSGQKKKKTCFHLTWNFDCCQRVIFLFSRNVSHIPIFYEIVPEAAVIAPLIMCALACQKALCEAQGFNCSVCVSLQPPQPHQSRWRETPTAVCLSFFFSYSHLSTIFSLPSSVPPSYLSFSINCVKPRVDPPPPPLSHPTFQQPH